MIIKMLIKIAINNKIWIKIKIKMKMKILKIMRMINLTNRK